MSQARELLPEPSSRGHEPRPPESRGHGSRTPVAPNPEPTIVGRNRRVARLLLTVMAALAMLALLAGIRW
jgi:hypothetical protein